MNLKPNVNVSIEARPRKQNFAASVYFSLSEDKRRVGFGTKCFFPPDLALTDRAASGRLLICCSSPAKGGEGSTKNSEKDGTDINLGFQKK